MRKVDISGRRKKEVTLADIGDAATCGVLLAARNEIADFPRLRLAALTTLSLADNSLRALPEDIDALLPSLRSLDVRGNAIESLPPALASLSQLRSLDVSFNRLHGLPPELAELPMLEELHVAGNPLWSVPMALVEPPATTPQLIEYLRDLGTVAFRRSCSRVLLLGQATAAAGKQAIIDALTAQASRLPAKQQQSQQQAQQRGGASHVSVTRLSKGLDHDLECFDFDAEAQSIGVAQLFFGPGSIFVVFVAIDPAADPGCKAAEFAASSMAAQIRFAEARQRQPFPTTLVVGTHAHTLPRATATAWVESIVSKLAAAFPRAVPDCEESECGPAYLAVVLERTGRDADALLQSLATVSARLQTGLAETPGFYGAVLRYCRKHCQSFAEDRVVSEETLCTWSTALGITEEQTLAAAEHLCTTGKFSTFPDVHPRFFFLEPHSLADVVFSLSSLDVDSGCFAKIADLDVIWHSWGFPPSNPFAGILQSKGIAPVVPAENDAPGSTQILVSWKIPAEPPKTIGSMWPLATPGDVRQFGREWIIDKDIPIGLFSQVLVELRAFRRFSVQCTWKHGALVTAEAQGGVVVQALYTSHLQVLNRRQTLRLQARFPAAFPLASSAIWMRLVNEVIESALEHAGCRRVRRFARCPHCADRNRAFLFPIEEVLKAAVVGRESLCNGSVSAKIQPVVIAPDIALADLPCDKMPGRFSRSVVFSPEDEVPGSLSEIAQLQRHLCWMSRLQHPRIARPRSVSLVPLAIIMEGSCFGDLRNFMFPQKGQYALGDMLSWRSRLRIAVDVACAMQCLHEHGVAHPLLCASSVLVYPSEEWGLTLNAKLCGLGPRVCGEASVAESDFWESKMHEQQGSLHFDVFLFGLLLWELFLMRPARQTIERRSADKLLPEVIVESLRQHLKTGIGAIEAMTSHQDTVVALGNLAWKCLRADPARREGFGLILKSMGQQPIPPSSTASDAPAVERQQAHQRMQSVLQEPSPPPHVQPLPLPRRTATLGSSAFGQQQQQQQPVPLSSSLQQRPSQGQLVAQKSPSPSLVSPNTLRPTSGGQQSPPSSINLPSPASAGPAFDATVATAMPGTGVVCNSALPLDRNTLVFAFGKTASVVCVPSFATEATLPVGSKDECEVAAVLEHGLAIWTVTKAGALRCWQRQKLSLLQSIFLVPPAAIECAVLVPQAEGASSARIWCGSSSRVIVVDAPAMAVVNTATVAASCLHYSPKTDVVYAGSAGEVVALGSWDCRIKARSTMPGMRPLSLLALAGKLWVGSVGALVVCNAFTLEQEAEMQRYEQVRSLVAFSCGPNVYVAAGGLVVSIWNPDRLQCLREFDNDAGIPGAVRTLSLSAGLLVATSASDGAVLTIRSTEQPFMPVLVHETRAVQHRSQFVHWMSLALEYGETRVLDVLNGMAKFRHLFEDPMLALFGASPELADAETTPAELKEKLFLFVCASRLVDLIFGQMLSPALLSRPDMAKDARICLLTTAPGNPIPVPPNKLQISIKDPVFDIGKALGETVMRVHKEHIKCLTPRGTEVLAECVVRRFAEWLCSTQEQVVAAKMLRPALEEALAHVHIEEPISVETLVRTEWTDRDLFQNTALYDGKSLHTPPDYNADLPPRMGTRETAQRLGYKELAVSGSN